MNPPSAPGQAQVGRYCPKCGQAISGATNFCSHCGKSLNAFNDEHSFGFALLGFLLPLIGFILYLVMQANSPKKAVSAGRGAICGFMVGLLIGAIVYLRLPVASGDNGLSTIGLANARSNAGSNMALGAGATNSAAGTGGSQGIVGPPMHKVEYRVTGNATRFAVGYVSSNGLTVLSTIEPTQMEPLWQYSFDATSGQKLYFNTVISRALPDSHGVDQSEVELHIFVDGVEKSSSSAFQLNDKGEAEYTIP
jgi:hypothetical protein